MEVLIEVMSVLLSDIVLFMLLFISSSCPYSADSDTCEGIRCHPNAECIEFVPSRRRLCVCKEGWQGDGRACFGMWSKEAFHLQRKSSWEPNAFSFNPSLA